MGRLRRAAPAELGRRVTDRKVHLAGRGEEGVGVFDRQRPRRRQVVEADQAQRHRRAPRKPSLTSTSLSGWVP